MMGTLQEDRERLVIRRFKFEEPRPEQIQDLEVCISNNSDLKIFLYLITYSYKNKYGNAILIGLRCFAVELKWHLAVMKGVGWPLE